jgi:hypothetical protein
MILTWMIDTSTRKGQPIGGSGDDKDDERHVGRISGGEDVQRLPTHPKPYMTF